MASKTPVSPGTPDRRPDAEQAMLMREVDDAVRQDQAASLARKYGLVIGIALLVLLALFGGWLYWRHTQETALEERAEELVTAIDELEAGNDRIADEELAGLAGSAASGPATSARLMRAAIALQQNRHDDAVALYDEVAADEDAPRPYRDFATIRSVAIAYDDLEAQAVIDRLGPLAVEGNPWFGGAGELVAMAYLAQGKEAEAGPLLAGIARSEDVPESLRARTRQLAGLLGYDAIEDVDETLAGIAGPGAAGIATGMDGGAGPQ